MTRRKGGHPGKKREPRRHPLLASCSRFDLEELVFRQDAMLGQRNIAIEEIRSQLPDSLEALRTRMLDVLFEQLPLDELYDRMGREEEWVAA